MTLTLPTYMNKNDLTQLMLYKVLYEGRFSHIARKCKSYLYRFILVFCLALTTSAYAEDTAKQAVKAPISDQEDATVILSWGDSLSAAYGLSVEQGWVSLLQAKLNTLPAFKDKPYQVINGSISGETTQGGLERLPKALEQHKPDLVLLELGANDGLRGINPNIMRNNLESMIKLILKSGAEIIVLGIKLPPNYGPIYNKRFDASFTELAEQYHLPLHPFFLEKVALNYDLMQEDGLHPTAEAQPIILDTVWPIINKSLIALNGDSATSDEDKGEMTVEIVVDGKSNKAEKQDTANSTDQNTEKEKPQPATTDK